MAQVPQNFELEGDILDDEADARPDWSSRFDAEGNSLVGSDCTFVQDDLSTSGETDRTTFAQSNKNNDLIATWNWATGQNPPKDDLANVYTCAVITAEGELLVYAGAERLAPEGDSHIDFQFYQDEIGLDQAVPCDDEQAGDPPCEFTGEKQVGDFVVSVDFLQGGTLGSVSLRIWNGTEYVLAGAFEDAAGVQGCNPENGLPAETICAFSNTERIDGGPWPNYDRHGNVIERLEPNQFTEFGVNVTELLGGTPCIATFIVKTRTSGSFTSELKDFALAPFNTCPTKSGTKFHDLNGNGVRDAGEPGLEGWEIRAYADTDGDGVLDADELSDPEVELTDGDGNYSFTLQPGTYVVCEVLPAGWMQSMPTGQVCAADAALAPGGYAIDLSAGEDDTGNDFGNFRQAAKSGLKFEDLDADGMRDEGEPGLAGWTIFVDYNDNGVLDPGEPSAVTGPGGTYEITGVNPGTWNVREVQQPGWTCSFPSPCVQTETFGSGESIANNDFGNWSAAAKSGVKFHDLNANGLRDAGEPGLAGWTIFVDYDGNGRLDAGEPSAVTGAGGAYAITGIRPGTFTVREVQQAGWICSAPQPSCAYTETFTSRANETGNDFGNYQLATKAGTKFQDVNRNGQRDAGEPGLAGWTIRAYADANGNGLADAGEQVAASATTDASGAYSLALEPGRYVVCEVLQATWRQEAPRNTVCAAVAGLGQGGHAITLASGETDAGNDFGNSTIINLAITKTDAPDPVLVGENVTYTVTVRNTSQHTATEVVVTDPLPLDRVSFVSVASSQGACTGVAPMTCALGTLAPGASATITIVVRANATGTVTNPARVVAREEEETLADNEAETTTLVVAPVQPPAVCASLTLDRRGAKVGRRVVVRAVVRDTTGARMAGQRVIARGAGVRTAARTNANGVARLTIRPRSAGVIRFRVAGTRACTAQIRVRAVFRPPLTGRTSG